MNNIAYDEKMESLLKYFKFATKLAEALNVHRMSIQNWRNDSGTISNENKLAIDMLYAKYCIMPNLQKSEVNKMARELMQENHEKFMTNIDIVVEVSKKNAFGSLEVEIDDIDEKLFYRVIDGSYIEKDIDKRKFLEMNNLAVLTKQILIDAQENKIQSIESETIKRWHNILMLGIRDDAGMYSRKIRIIPDLKITLTAPEDIAEEIEYWVKKYKNVQSIEEIAHAHEHFELIHPFGDGNGRIGRLIVASQFIKNGMLPPLIDRHNKALYYVTLEQAQVTGNIIPLVYFFCDAVQRMKEKVGIR